MFELTDIPRLLMSAMIILPIVMIIRESGYYGVATLLGATNKKLTVGCGPMFFQTRTLEVRRYFFMYSWMGYDELQPKSNKWHGLIYASPILTMAVAASVFNILLAEEVLPTNMFWEVFQFYLFFYILFDVAPVYLPNGQPTNGRAIFDLLWHGERSDFMKKNAEEEASQMQHASENQDDDISSDEASTQAQEETIKNRDRDQEEREDHASPS